MENLFQNVTTRSFPDRSCRESNLIVQRFHDQRYNFFFHFILHFTLCSVELINVENSALNHPGKPLQLPPPLRATPIWKQHISKRSFPYKSKKRTVFLCPL